LRIDLACSADAGAHHGGGDTDGIGDDAGAQVEGLPRPRPRLPTALGMHAAMLASTWMMQLSCSAFSFAAMVPSTSVSKGSVGAKTLVAGIVEELRVGTRARVVRRHADEANRQAAGLVMGSDAGLGRSDRCPRRGDERRHQPRSPGVIACRDQRRPL
jgi:hypothetical protein